MEIYPVYQDCDQMWTGFIVWNVSLDKQTNKKENCSESVRFIGDILDIIGGEKENGTMQKCSGQTSVFTIVTSVKCFSFSWGKKLFII